MPVLGSGTLGADQRLPSQRSLSGVPNERRLFEFPTAMHIAVDTHEIAVRNDSLAPPRAAFSRDQEVPFQRSMSGARVGRFCAPAANPTLKQRLGPGQATPT